jgi:integrase/recombinase XerD
VTEKGSKTRAVTFTEVTAALLAAWLDIRQKEVKEVFYNLDTLEPLTRNGLYQALRRMARRAGITGRFNPHSFRHAFAREYIKAGGDIVTLSMLMGHRETSTTARHYLIFSNREVIEAHEKYSPAKLLPGVDEGLTE